MITLIESLFGSKAGRLIAEVLAALLLVGFFVLHFEHKGALAELGKLQKSSAVLVAKAQAQITQDAAQYSSAQKANQEKTDEAAAMVASLQSELADSVRQYDAYRRSHPPVARPAGVGPAAQPGERSAVDSGALIERLAVRGNELAGSVATLSAELQGCQRDRDALTGEPR